MADEVVGPPPVAFAAPPEPGLVTVLVPVFNGERYIRQSLESILGQTYADTEVLVLDDGSTDGTSSILAEYAPEARIERSQTNLGQFANVNRGLAMANGEYVAVMHADDVYAPEMLAVAVEALRISQEVGAAFCLDRFLDEAGQEYGRLELPASLRGGGVLDRSRVIDELLSKKNTFLRTPGAVVKRDVYERVGGFRTDLGSAADFEMWLRVADHGPIVLIDRYLFGYRHTAGSEGNSYQRSRLEPDLFFKIMDDHLEGTRGSAPSPGALRAFEAHRAEDLLLLACRAYAMGRSRDFEALLRRVRPTALVGSSQIARFKMLFLYGLARVAKVLPNQRWLRNLIASRWHVPPAEVRS